MASSSLSLVSHGSADAGPSRPRQPLVAHTVPKEMSTESLRGWVRGLVDKPKHAIFQVKMTIEELQQVPQMQGEFMTEWQINGRRPHGKDALALRTQPSLPNMKTTEGPAASASSASLHSLPSSAGSSSSSISGLGITLSPLTISPAASNPPSPRAIKKPTDPTPLRQSIGPDSSPVTPSTEHPVTESPELLPPPEIFGGRKRQNSLDSGETGSSDKSSPAASSVVYFGETAPRPSRKLYDEAVVPRSNLPATRSGTTPSAATLLDPVPGRGDFPLMRPPTITRSATARSVETIPEPKRSRILSTSSARRTASDATSSPHRKGSTPPSSLHQYTVNWKEFTIHHTIKIPLGKPVSASGVSTPGKSEQAPLLGGGRDSESGFKLSIYEVQGSTLSDGPNGMNKDALSVMHGVHVAKRHPDRQASEGREKHKGKTLYGTVHSDFAQFAGRGKVHRMFLLAGCKTNARIRVMIEVKQIGGDTHWAAPPLEDGHHVTGVRDLVGDDQPALHELVRNSSGSSSGSSASANVPAPARSATSLVGSIPGPSKTSLAPAKTSYDHHLKPSDANRGPPTPMPRHPSTLGVSVQGRPASGEPDDHPTPTQNTDHLLNPYHLRKVSPHHRHSLYVRHHGRRGLAQHQTFMGVNEQPADVIIEAIFNPRPVWEEPKVSQKSHLPARDRPAEDAGEVEGESPGADADEGQEGKPGTVWGRMRQRAQSKASKDKKDKD